MRLIAQSQHLGENWVGLQQTDFREVAPHGHRSNIQDWSQWSGLNRRPTVYETVALPLSYIGLTAYIKALVNALILGLSPDIVTLYSLHANR